MPQEITAYRANDGSIHETACLAATRDLEEMVNASPLAENGPYAKKLVDWLKSDAPAIRDALGAYADACPIPPKVEAPSVEPEGTQEEEEAAFGLGVKDRQAGRTLNHSHGLVGAKAEAWKRGWNHEDDEINAYGGPSIYPNPDPRRDS